jgi:hypothetical protein
MYDAVLSTDEPPAQGARKRVFCCCCTPKCALHLLLNCAFVGVLGAILGLTYNRCVWCVVSVAVVSALTMNCVPLTPIIFMLSMAVLVMHAIDYRSASIRVEVPLQDVVYIPTWDDVQNYVHVDKPLGAGGKK